MSAGRDRRHEEGQALVEFAIVAPLIVMVLMFSIWFVELVQIKLKVQEAARYAAWEATSYKLHDYDKGPSELNKLSSDMTKRVSVEAMLRYSDLDSSSATPTLNNRIFAASWTPPLIFVIDQQEEAIYGGPIVNFLFGIAGTLFDFFSGLGYKSPNLVAQSLIAVGKDYGGAMSTRMFGSSEWGFNKRSYAMTTVSVIVQNNWLNRGVGKMILPNWGAFLTERHAVLADPWHLDTGRSLPNTPNASDVGFSKDQPYWKQVDRMYMMRKPARKVLEGWVKLVKMMDIAVGLTTHEQSPFKDSDFTTPAVVSRGYYDDAGTSGQVRIRQDNTTQSYDTSPVGLDASGAGKSLTEYGKSLKNRGRYFMGCDKEMSLGCPSSTLQQDNPFGDYIHRE